MKELKPGDLAMWFNGEDNLPVTILVMEGPRKIPGFLRVVEVLVEGEVDVAYLRDLVPCVDGLRWK